MNSKANLVIWITGVPVIPLYSLVRVGGLCLCSSDFNRQIINIINGV
ncbi:hypothetical protein OSCI_930009 [Kamptonema sp. PCC 6506]|nr:hypothetical protein OSCI_930009 [Kamptonema sp. PCC 6506]